MPAALTAERVIRTTTLHESLIANENKKVSNALECAADAPISSEVKIAALIAGLATFGIGAVLILGIRKFYQIYQASEKQREQAEFACRIIFQPVEDAHEDEKRITIKLDSGNTVVCSEKFDGLWISTNGGTARRHSELGKIQQLKEFFRADIKQNSDFYIEKNPDNSLIALLCSAVKEDNSKADELFDLFQNLACGRKFSEFQRSLLLVEEFEVTRPQQSVFKYKVKFGDFRMVSLQCEDGQLDRGLFELKTNGFDNNATKILKPKTLKRLLNKATHSSNSFSFEANISEVALFLRKTTTCSNPLQLIVKKEDGNSVVTVNIPGKELERIHSEIHFQGDLKLNDRLFKAVNNKIHVPNLIYEAREITEDNNLRAVIKSIANPSKWRSLLDYVVDITNCSFQIKQFDQMRKDLHRSISLFPEFSEDHEIFTQQRYTKLIQDCFSNTAELENLTSDDRDFYEEFCKLSTDDKNRFLSSLKQGVSQHSTSLQLIFFQFDSKKQARLKRAFFGVDDRLAFYGTNEQLQAKISSLSIQDQALFLIVVDQGYKAFSSIRALHFRGSDNISVSMQSEMPFIYKVMPINSNRPKEVRIEVTKSRNFVDDGDVIGNQQVYGLYTVSFKKGTGLAGANIRLSNVELKLTMPNKNGSFPTVCKTLPMAGGQITDYEILRQRGRVLKWFS
ncbi:MAG: hypothetical protein K0R08_1176 [Solimicrobium sp.]|nr:hypothetical protein [Solimicrobium sp.]